MGEALLCLVYCKLSAWLRFFPLKFCPYFSMGGSVVAFFPLLTQFSGSTRLWNSSLWNTTKTLLHVHHLLLNEILLASHMYMLFYCQWIIFWTVNWRNSLSKISVCTGDKFSITLKLKRFKAKCGVNQVKQNSRILDFFLWDLPGDIFRQWNYR